MTKAAMERAGFRPAACDAAARSNEAVDDRQGNNANDTNLHAMRGFVMRSVGNLQVPQLESEEELRAAVDDIIKRGRAGVVSAISKGDFEAALKTLGETLHTIQDRAFHRFEPWPYSGIGDAMKQNPNYMICHAIRDLSVVSDIIVAEKRAEIELSRRIFGDVYAGARLFYNGQEPSPYRPPMLQDQGFAGAGFLFSITIGAAPGSIRKDTRETAGRSTEAPFWTTTMSGVGMRTRAEDDTAEFIASIRREVTTQPNGNDAWNAFVSWPGKAAVQRTTP
jgi:hypothetical protein